MALKSYTFKSTLKKKGNRKRKKKRGRNSGGFVRDATGAILGVALFSEVAGALRSI